MLCLRLKIPVFARLCSFTLVFDDLHAKTYHPEGCFRKNKPNSPNVQMNASLFITTIYTIFTSLTKVKNKPNQTQYKPNSKPMARRPKMNVNICNTKIYSNETYLSTPKTKPNQTQNKPNTRLSSVCAFLLFCRGFILECRSRGPNFKDKRCCRASHQPLLLRVILSDTSIRFFIT